MSCYVNCRVSLQGGGRCKDSKCKCFPKDGKKRPEDNTWFELSEENQKRILDIEDRFEAIPAVMTTGWLDDIISTLKPARTRPPTTAPTTTPSTTTPSTTTTTPEATTTIETTVEDIWNIDRGSEEPKDVVDDSTAWDDGSGAGDDEDSDYEDTDSWW